MLSPKFGSKAYKGASAALAKYESWVDQITLSPSNSFQCQLVRYHQDVTCQCQKLLWRVLHSSRCRCRHTRAAEGLLPAIAALLEAACRLQSNRAAQALNGHASNLQKFQPHSVCLARSLISQLHHGDLFKAVLCAGLMHARQCSHCSFKHTRPKAFIERVSGKTSPADLCFVCGHP